MQGHVVVDVDAELVNTQALEFVAEFVRYFPT